MKKVYQLIIFSLFSTISLFALPFNSKLTQEEITQLNDGQVVIKNIDHAKNMSLEGTNELSIELKKAIKNLSPKYLAEIIRFIPYEGNENLPEKIEQMLEDVPSYAGIPYWSVHNQRFYDLYSSAEIIELNKQKEETTIIADLEMLPFGTVNEKISIKKSDNCILYFSENLNPLNYKGKFDCIGKKNMNVGILVFRENENWILYGIGGVNAPKVPLLNDRIETSFINKMKTFCNFIFTKIDN